MTKLFIYIPTYNRSNELYRTLDSLFYRFNSIGEVRIHVSDNGGDRPLNLGCHYPAQVASGQLRYTENSSNIGMSANIIKAFDYVGEASWLWILSDDDLLSEFNSIELLAMLEGKERDFAAVKFNGSNEAEASLNYEEVLEECNSISGLNSYLFLSNTIYNVKYVSPHVLTGYMNLHTYIPHFLILLKVLSTGSVMFSYPFYLVIYVVPEIGYNYWKVAGLGVSGVKNINWEVNNDLHRKTINIFHIHNDYKVLIELRLDSLKNDSIYNYQYHSRIYLALIRDGRGFLSRATVRLFAIIIYFKGFFLLLLKILVILGLHRKHINEILKKYV